MTLLERSISRAVAELEMERNGLRAELEELQAREHEVGRALYRRGYNTGYAAGCRRALKESSPERHARGWARAAMGAE